MADDTPVELKRLISNFRVSELHSLLNFAGRSKKGRSKRTDLLKRALAIVDGGCPPAIAFKIHQLSRLRQPVTSKKDGSSCVVSAAEELEQPAITSATVSATSAAPETVSVPCTATITAPPTDSSTESLRYSRPTMFPPVGRSSRSSATQNAAAANDRSGLQTSSMASVHHYSATYNQPSGFLTAATGFQSHTGPASNNFVPAPGASNCLSAPTGGSCSNVGMYTVGSHAAPLHPDVRLKPLPFYDLIDTLLKPSSLSAVACKTIMYADNYRRASFSFCLTPRQVSQILESQHESHDMLAGDDCSIVEYGMQIQLRFCLSETTSEQDDCFPANISVLVNNREVTLPNLIPSNKVGVDPKRPSRPLNITSLAALSPCVPNNISVMWSVSADPHHSHCVGVYLVHCLTSKNLLSRLKQKGMRHKDHTRALINEKLSQNSDSEISTTSLRISLMCPLSKQRMLIPCRPSSCSHLQCFDAETFLQMNEKKSTWSCPVCNKPAEFWALNIDGLFTEILTESEECNDIQFSASGQWTALQPVQTTQSVRVMDDSVVIETIEDSPTDSTKVELIDLTETDEDDNDAICCEIDDDGNGVGDNVDDDNVHAVSPNSAASSASSDSTITLEGFQSHLEPQMQQRKKAQPLVWTSSSSSSSSASSSSSHPTTTSFQSTASSSDDADVISLD